MIYYTICQVDWETRDPINIGLFSTNELAIYYLFNEVLSYGKDIDNKLNGKAVIQEYERIKGYLWNSKEIKYNYKIIPHDTEDVIKDISDIIDKKKDKIKDDK